MADRPEKLARKAKMAAERTRTGPDHRPVDRLGDAYEEGGPPLPDAEPGMGDDRPRAPGRRGTLDPYHRDDPGEASPQDSPARPKAPPQHEATEEGRLAEPGKGEEKEK